MTDEQALLNAIEASPRDITPRLVYADWLDETGVEEDMNKARFIRLQCNKATDDDGFQMRYFSSVIVPSLGQLAEIVTYEDVNNGFVESLGTTSMVGTEWFTGSRGIRVLMGLQPRLRTLFRTSILLNRFTSTTSSSCIV